MESEERKKIKIQKITQKVLIIFVVSMIILTIVSKVFNSITVPKVTVAKVSRGGIIFDIEGQGELVASNDYKIDILEGLIVNKVSVKSGELIHEGDILVEYDPASIENAIANQYQNLLNTQQDYWNKKENYNDILSKTELTEAQKNAKEAQEEFDKAEIDLQKAKKRYEEKMSDLTSRLQEDQLKEYEQVTKDKENATETYNKCKNDYQSKKDKAQAELQKASDNESSALRDAQRDYDSAVLAFDEYCKDFNRVNNAFVAFTSAVEKNEANLVKPAQDKMLQEYFGESTYEKIVLNTFDDQYSYGQIMPIYNNITVAILDYQGAVSSRNALSTKDAIELADAKVKDTYNKLYELIVKQFEVDKVISHDKEMNVTKAKERLDELNSDSGKLLKDAKDTYNRTIEALDKELKEAEDAYNKAIKEYDKVMKKVYEDTDSEENLLATLENAQSKRDMAEKTLEAAKSALTKEERASMNDDTVLSLSEHTLNSSLLKIAEIEDCIKQLEELKEKEGILYAQMDGSVTEVSVDKYTTTTGAEKIIVASDDCFFRGTITKEMMDYVEIGDQVNLKLNGQKKIVEMEVTKVYLDAMDNSIAHIEASLSQGGYTVGTGGNFTYQKSGETSQNCISITAIRQDGNNNYVLIPQEENSVLGNVTRAYRVDVRVVNKDSRTAIIEGAVSQGDLVITESSKIIGAGDIVRIDD